jgi:hypothetical protein
VTTFSEPQNKRLAGKLDGKHVRTRELRGRTLSYVEGWHVIAEANRIFGFDGWDRETAWAECIWAETKREPRMCAYAARVRIRVRAGETVVCREGSGVGHGSGTTLGEAHESALKEAETDAMKRALAAFDNLFGLALYDKEQNGVRRSKSNRAAGQPLALVLLSSNGEPQGSHDNPQSFCAAMRESLASMQSLEELQAVWARNATTISQLRTILPELKTAQGTHYADVLEKLYEQHGARLASLTKQDETVRETVTAGSVFFAASSEEDPRCVTPPIRRLTAGSYRGHNHPHKFRVWISGQVRRVTKTIRREMAWAAITSRAAKATASTPSSPLQPPHAMAGDAFAGLDHHARQQQSSNAPGGWTDDIFGLTRGAGPLRNQAHAQASRPHHRVQAPGPPGVRLGRDALRPVQTARHLPQPDPGLKLSTPRGALQGSMRPPGRPQDRNVRAKAEGLWAAYAAQAWKR